MALVVKTLPASAGDGRDVSSVPELCFIEKAVSFCKETARRLDLGWALRTQGPVGAAEEVQEAEETKEEQLETRRKTWGWGV